MAGATGIAELRAQPAQPVFDQRDRLHASRRRLGGSRVVSAEQKHQGCRQLLSPPPGPLGLEGMPIAIANHQLALKCHGLREGALWPAAGGDGLLRSWHWTSAGSGVHPDAIAAPL